MAIRFVDKGPGDDPDRKATPTRPKPSGRSSASSAAPIAPDPAAAAAPITADRAGETDRVGEAEVSKLPHPKPEPKARSRKGPPSRAATPVIEPAQVSLEGLLPDLPHAKPEPKPRGRKKAFG